jgi:hypothetical protein
VQDRRDDILYGHKKRWADMDSDDDNNPVLRNASAKSKPRAKLTRREDSTGASSSHPPPVAANAKSKPRPEAGRAAGRSRSRAGQGRAASRSRSPVAPRRQTALERANFCAFRANDMRTVPVFMPGRASTARPDRIFRADKVEFWLGSILDLAQDSCLAVPTYSLVVDCMGSQHNRPWAKDNFVHTALLESPWNDQERRHGHLVAVLNWIIANVLTEGGGAQRVIVICRKGEGRSAAVLAIMLILLYDFTLNAAAAQISDRRPAAKLTTELVQIEALLSKVKADLVWR